MSTTKEFLDAELAKYETWETSDKFIKGLFDNQRSFETAKGMGIGRDTILKFLGKNWKWGSLAPTRLTSGSLRNVEIKLFRKSGFCA